MAIQVRAIPAQDSLNIWQPVCATNPHPRPFIRLDRAIPIYHRKRLRIFRVGVGTNNKPWTPASVKQNGQLPLAMDLRYVGARLNDVNRGWSSGSGLRLFLCKIPVGARSLKTPDQAHTVPR